MNYNIKIGEKSFEVSIEDINKRPIVARVNGHEFLVSPEIQQVVSAPTLPQGAAPASHPHPNPVTGSDRSGVLLAPLPGTVIEVFVKPAERVEAGQVVMVIEAMKMKNSIRSTQDGVIAQVLVSAGQTVAHKQTLVEFEE